MERGPSKEGALGRPMDEPWYPASDLPELRIEEALDEIRKRVVESGRRVVVLDDDPTGVQSVHGVPVLTTWVVEDLHWALEQTSPTFFGSPTPAASPRRRPLPNREIARNLSEAAEPRTDFDVVSRSDSTLRGHYPAETDALAETLEEVDAGPPISSSVRRSSKPAGSRWTTSTGCAKTAAGPGGTNGVRFRPQLRLPRLRSRRRGSRRKPEDASRPTRL